MDPILLLVIFTIAVALLFDVVNGFHDAANSIATVVSTRVLSPRYAVLWAAFFNFVAMFFFAPRVADTIAKIVHVTNAEPAYVYVVLAGLIGAIVWDLLTWRWGLPVSSSHALIGGFVGAGMAYGGAKVVHWGKVGMAAGFIPLAPIMGLLLGAAIMLGVFWVFRTWKPSSVDCLFRKGQLLSAALYSLGHGGNDAQKTMGIIVALLVAAGYARPDLELSLTSSETLWIILSCHAAMAIGTAFGGWRIVKTMGMRITKLKPVGGFCAETAGAITLFMATHMGIPVSTTHTITGAIVGVGSTTKFSRVKWGIAGRIVWAWILTIPLSGFVAALTFWAIAFCHPEF
ncbi:inorganic phosphate transporter [Candidatus Sumerlaeota bacterium]|nr:inorganic phosphate transporter [Candidatus Sumerlaeota bacterium]